MNVNGNSKELNTNRLGLNPKTLLDRSKLPKKENEPRKMKDKNKGQSKPAVKDINKTSKGREPKSNYRSDSRRNIISEKSFKANNEFSFFNKKQPISTKAMENLLMREPYIISVELLRMDSGYHELLEKENLDEHKIGLILKLIDKTITNKSNHSGSLDLLLLTFKNANFIQNLLNFISDIKYEYSKACEYLTIIHEIAQQFSIISPIVAFPIVSNLTDICKGAIEHLKLEQRPEADLLDERFQDIVLQLKATREEWKKSRDAKRHNSIKPLNDFRVHGTELTCAELNTAITPYIRPLIIVGSYEDSQHYLDTQFRLLKEDFVRPLRNGLQSYRVGETKRSGGDVRVYSNVRFVGVTVQRNGTEIIHNLQLKLRKNFDIANSKCLMYGNIICISGNDFKTMITASVEDRDNLRKGVIGVKLESEPYNLDEDKEYTCIESKSFFLAYKYTLEALQELDRVPLEDYIIEVKESESLPRYLIKDTNSTYTVKIGEDKYTVSLSEGIDHWPSSNEIGMNESQRRALYSALTRKVAIIQGPPGTGKTFLGLQITKILLNNKLVWSNGAKHPILVLCYTNHALDQFLEGMISFTEKIVRVGSRSKNEALSKYQIKNWLGQRFYDHANDYAVFIAYNDAKKRVSDTKYCIDDIANVLKRIDTPGILNLDSFIQAASNIIPSHLFLELKSTSMEHFLLGHSSESVLEEPNKSVYLNQSFKSLNSVGNRTVEVHQHQMINDDNDEMDFNVDEELRREEEFDRILDEDDDSDQDFTGEKKFYLHFEITYEDIGARKLSLLSKIDGLKNDEEVHELEYELKMVYFKLKILMDNQHISGTEESCSALESVASIHDLHFRERWELYNNWKIKLSCYYAKLMELYKKRHRKEDAHMKNLKNMMSLNAMKKADIVGMTITGAAKDFRILHDLASPIVIIEEAAEIMEPHLIGALSPSCQHLIMIGDHQQLRPKPNVYELGVKYNLNISLFERMIKNGIKHEVLEYQHRMKPSFSSLLVPTIYKELKDHSSVQNRPKIRGIAKDLFFVDHSQMENAPFDGCETFENLHEAKFLMSLCTHLILQGYTSDDITIITPYFGQYRCLKKLQNWRYSEKCNDVRISVLDNYQGEESNIILLSLVRSNSQEKIGFLKTTNRVCVALSRAKLGMYIIGNMSQLKKSSSLWSDIHQKLVDGEHIGRHLPLLCQNHPEEPIMVSSSEDIENESPNGGCKRICERDLPNCSHACPLLLCHPYDKEHTSVKCSRPCQKKCDLGHPCQQLCFVKCVCHVKLDETLPHCDHVVKVKCYKKNRPNCKRGSVCLNRCVRCYIPVEKTLPCGHVQRIPCYVPTAEFKCQIICDKELPLCKHVVSLKCHVNVSTHPCPENCKDELNCGHKCSLKCHIINDPDHKRYKCKESCQKSPLNCELGHACVKKCYEECGSCETKISRDLKCGHTKKLVKCGYPKGEIQCIEKCNKILPCDHKCLKDCSVPCGHCEKIVRKLNPECGHSLMIACSKEPSLKLCSQRCIKNLNCGHSCIKRCRDTCTIHCMEAVSSEVKCGQGHALVLPCHLTQEAGQTDHVETSQNRKLLNSYCSEKCTSILDCGHKCKGNCAQCSKNGVHASCREICGKPLICGHRCKGKCSQCSSFRVHASCEEVCNKTLICGHTCKATCNTDCPSCQEPCMQTCHHSTCSKICSIACKKCKERCQRSCPHSFCRAFCGNKCNRKPCSKPCPRPKRKCSHPCIGFCGEPCPVLCRICDKEEVEKIIARDGGDDESRFVKLDCTHIFEAQFLDRHVQTPRADQAEGVSKCPLCGTPIYNTPRYRSVLWPIYVKVLEEKQRQYEQQKKARQELQDSIREIESHWRREAFIIRKEIENYSKDGDKARIETQFGLWTSKLEFMKAATKTDAKLGSNQTQRQALTSLVKTVVLPARIISLQMMNELTRELRRIEVLTLVEINKVSSLVNQRASEPLSEIEALINRSGKFDEITEEKVNQCLRQIEQATGLKQELSSAIPKRGNNTRSRSRSGYCSQGGFGRYRGHNARNQERSDRDYSRGHGSRDLGVFDEDYIRGRGYGNPGGFDKYHSRLRGPRYRGGRSSRNRNFGHEERCSGR